MSTLAPTTTPGPGRSAYVREVGATLKLGWPLIVSQVAQMAINTTDVVMMGWLGPRELGAGALAGNLYVPMLMLGIGLGVAVSALVSQVRGANPNSVRDVRRSARQGFWATTAVSAPALIVLWNIEPILLLFGQDAAQAAMARAYMHAMMWGFLPAIWFITLRAFLSSLERTGAVLVITLLTILLNAGSNWVFMFGNLGAPRLELVGAGISSTFANT
ncbi:MAG: MATE family efflux transporter, partial [Pseudomonadota bacterium]